MMKDFPSCFGENGVQIVDSSSKGNKNLQSMVSCVYQSKLHGCPCTVTFTWSRSLASGFSISIDDSSGQSLCKVDIKPWLFSKKKGFKTIEADNGRLIIDILWDLSAVKFGFGPEPLEGFYVAIVSNHEIVLLLGDLTKEAYQRTKASPPPSNPVLISKRKHVFGKRVYATTAQFRDNGQTHEISIECDYMKQKNPDLEIKIDKKRVLQVKHLRWKFRGNQTILVDGIPVEVCWDVHSWFFGGSMGNAVFMFQTFLSADKLLPLSSSQILGEKQLQGLGFSLILYAWKNE